MWFVRAFLVMAVLDVFWTMTVRKVSQGRAVPAALYSGCLVACQGFITVAYIEHGILAAVPVVFGSVVGTWGTCKFDSRRHQTGTKK